MASNRPGEMQLTKTLGSAISTGFQWPQIGRVRCNVNAAWTARCAADVSMASNRPGEMQQHPSGVGVDGFHVSMASNRPGEMQLLSTHAELS